MTDTGNIIYTWLLHLVKSEEIAALLTKTILLTAAVAVSFFTRWLIRRLFDRLIRETVQKTKTNFDDIMLKRGMLTSFYQLIPLIILYISVGAIFDRGNILGITLNRILISIIAVVIILAINKLLDTIDDFYRQFDIAKRTPIRSYLQLVKIFMAVIALIFVIATLLNKSPWGIMSSIGAMTAIVLLIFKDWILGLVASIQIHSNELVNIGDWIEMPKYNADGDVMDITLSTVRVQNWDKTITSIPSYALVSESFINWRGMMESGGRRMKRVIYIDVNSIRFCDSAAIEKFRKIRLLTSYINEKEKEILVYNSSKRIKKNDLMNGRKLTNIGTFRAYVREYLKNHPSIRQDMTMLVRHREPGEHGLPVEIYAFINNTDWAPYEDIQADIFDHIFAVLPSFDLKIFQNPSGSDFRSLGSRPRIR